MAKKVVLIDVAGINAGKASTRLFKSEKFRSHFECEARREGSSSLLGGSPDDFRNPG